MTWTGRVMKTQSLSRGKRCLRVELGPAGVVWNCGTDGGSDGGGKGGVKKRRKRRKENESESRWILWSHYC